MARMFYTLEQAAERLDMPPMDLEAMVDKGLLRELRDGPKSLFKVTDIEAIEKSRPGKTANVPREASNAESAESPQAVAAEITLPRSATVLLFDLPGGDDEEALTTSAAGGFGDDPVRVFGSMYDRMEPWARPHDGAPVVWTAPPAPPRPRTDTSEMSFRHWIWLGLLDDRPYAIGLLFVMLMAGASALAFVVWFVWQAFR